MSSIKRTGDRHGGESDPATKIAQLKAERTTQRTKLNDILTRLKAEMGPLKLRHDKARDERAVVEAIQSKMRKTKSKIGAISAVPSSARTPKHKTDLTRLEAELKILTADLKKHGRLAEEAEAEYKKYDAKIEPLRRDKSTTERSITDLDKQIQALETATGQPNANKPRDPSPQGGGGQGHPNGQKRPTTSSSTNTASNPPSSAGAKKTSSASKATPPAPPTTTSKRPPTTTSVSRTNPGTTSSKTPGKADQTAGGKKKPIKGGTVN